MTRIEEIKNRLQSNEGQYHKDKIALDEDVAYLLAENQRLMEALQTAKDALDTQYKREGDVIQNNKAYMAIFNALQTL